MEMGANAEEEVATLASCLYVVVWRLNNDPWNTQRLHKADHSPTWVGEIGSGVEGKRGRAHSLSWTAAFDGCNE